MRLALLMAALLVAGPCRAECLSDAQAQSLVESFLAKVPAANPEGLNEADGACSRSKVNALLARHHGALVGYKAGLTNAAVQKRFNYDRPVWGMLYQYMLVAEGNAIEAGFGARPLFEADLLVRIKSKAVNQARTPAEVLKAIDQIIPFIELPDLAVQAPPRLNGPAINAINVGARLGVVGQPIELPLYRAERHALLDALRDMTVVVNDSAGHELARGRGSDILDHPLNAVIWLASELAKEGRSLQPGQLVSLGSFSPLLPPRPGLGVSVSYIGLPGAKPVSVSFK